MADAHGQAWMSRMTGNRWIVLAGLLAAVPTGVLGASKLPVLGYCDGCSVAMQWRLAAEATAQDLAPIERVAQEIYLVDRVGASVAAFSIRQQPDSKPMPSVGQGGGRPRSDRRALRAVDVERIDPDPAVRRAVLDGLRAANEVRQIFAFGRISIEDLGLTERIPSAIDLVGPEVTDAGRNRAALRDALGHYVNGIIGDAEAALDGPAREVMANLLSDRSAVSNGGFVIAFPDGTTIRVALDGLHRLPRDRQRTRAESQRADSS
ncbi:hypothetical protein [Halomonas denitrificans]|nr:hypothetical protein [Halomonas denitrificans]